MRKTILLLMAVLYTTLSWCQDTLRLVVRDDKTREVLPGTSGLLIPGNKTAMADKNGILTFSGIPNGRITIRLSFVGYISKAKTLMFPLANAANVTDIYLEPQSGELAEVVVQSTRSNQNLKNIPTRIEALPQEELNEKSTMRPGDIKMLLNESTGITIQPTSAVTGNASIRIQGLDSRYTQLLKDGMPLYQGFSGGLSLLQISPLDLKQVEFIKGSASTLYGGGAIAGLVNLISKVPTEKPELDVLLNGTSAGGADASQFYSQKWKHLGTTIYSSFNYNKPYDPAGTGFTAIPKTSRVTINPKLFLYVDKKNSGWIGVNAMYENRYGGDLQVIHDRTDNVHQYFERNKSYRVSSQLSFTHQMDSVSQFNVKSSVGHFDRHLSESSFSFSGKQLSSYSELNYVRSGKLCEWATGINLWTDAFKATAAVPLNYRLTTLGGFVQNTLKVTNAFSLESGLRVDYNTSINFGSGTFVLPRINALLKLNDQWTGRVGGGLGYKMPTLFNDQTEQDGFQNIQPLFLEKMRAEQSYGLNGDINFRSPIGDAFVNINQLFFYTQVNNPLLVENSAVVNASGYIHTRGTETNIRIIVEDLIAYFGYTYTNTEQSFNGQNVQQPLTPRNRVSADITYEIEGSLRAGVEGFYTSPQLLNNGKMGKGYTQYGLLLQKSWKHLDVFINGENLTDRRQTRWGSIYTGSITNPVFNELYAPLEGRVINAGVKIKL